MHKGLMFSFQSFHLIFLFQISTFWLIRGTYPNYLLCVSLDKLPEKAPLLSLLPSREAGFMRTKLLSCVHMILLHPHPHQKSAIFSNIL